MTKATTAPNPNYAPPMPQEIIKAIGRVGAGIWDGESTMWWGDWSHDPAFRALLTKLGAKSFSEAQPIEQIFTPAEIEALKKKHGSVDVNWQRAAAVKKAMGEGCDTKTKLVERLGDAWGGTQLSMDKSALEWAQNK